MTLTIVMYHYVRELARSRYPAIKGCDLAAFRRQLDHIERNYSVVTVSQVVAAVKGEDVLPRNAIWLTFDDGYSDHYDRVFPLLHARGWQGSFFPPARTVLDGELLDVNRIHFILAASQRLEPVINAIRDFVDRHGADHRVRSFAQYWSELALPGRLDPAEVAFVKRILQHGLPEDLRGELAGELFTRFVAIDETAFAAELYMSADQLRTMIDCGMYVGSHGAGHYWLDRLDPSRQAEEIDLSLAFLARVGAPTEDWVMCYPHGAYNDTLLPILRDRGCVVGLTTKMGVAELGRDGPMALPRLDTNDLPA